jgi:hypothetical protein
LRSIAKPAFSAYSATDDEVAALVERIAHSVMRYLKKIGYLDKEGDGTLFRLT